MTTDEVIATLHPVMQDYARRALPIMQAQMPKGSTVRIIDGFRTAADQAAARAADASKSILSWHQFGLAFDFGIFEADGTYVTNGKDPRYTLAGYAAKANLTRLAWGGDWREPDYDHIEYSGGFTRAQLQAWMDSHQFVVRM